MSARIACYGRLGDAPRQFAAASGKLFATASLAVEVEERRGSEKPSPLWIQVVAFGRHAEELLGHVKGDVVSVCGRLQRRRWAGPDGAERERLQVVCDGIVSARVVGAAAGREATAEREATSGVGRAAPSKRPLAEELDDEVPF